MKFLRKVNFIQPDLQKRREKKEKFQKNMMKF